MATFHYFDIHLRLFLGHFLDEAMAVTAAARRAGHTSRIYVMPAARPDLVAALGATVVREPGATAERSIDHFAREADRMTAAWAQLGDDTFAAGDMLFLSSLTAPYFTGLLRHLAALPRACRPAVVMRLYDGDQLFDPGTRGFVRQSAAWRRAMAEVEALAIPFTLVSETPTLARIATRVLGRRVLHVASPVAFDVELPPPPGPGLWGDRASPRILFICHRRGLPVPHLVRCLALVRRAQPDASLLVKLNDETSFLSPDARSAIGRRLGIPMIEEFLPQDMLMRMAAETDLMVLPYPVGSYEVRSSGPHLEAAGAGRPLVVPARSWMADEMGAGRAAGMVYTRDAPEAVAAAVAAALGKLPVLRRRAEVARSRLFAHHGSRLFTQAVLAAAAGTDAADGVATDDPVTFDRLGDGARLLGRGWGAAGVEGTPMSAATSELRLSIEPPLGDERAIDLVLEMIGPAAGPAMTANGIPVGDWELPAGRAVRRFGLHMPASRRLHLTFRVPEPAASRPTLCSLTIRPHPSVARPD
ncbi:MAG: hypothetical protein AB7P02_05365 [Alphaproteobacteria bacterium]